MCSSTMMLPRVCPKLTKPRARRCLSGQQEPREDEGRGAMKDGGSTSIHDLVTLLEKATMQGLR